MMKASEAAVPLAELEGWRQEVFGAAFCGGKPSVFSRWNASICSFPEQLNNCSSAKEAE